uniref:Ubiquitin-like domain-containing protein n=1 Tax=Kalanchoe fedtschenkoi TaxID=63787 RepID=A0A7N0T9M4_KALFE
MGSHSGDQADMLKVEETKSSEPTVEIKVKTLDSQTYTLRVDKCVPVPTLKDQIATVTGILSERQRLICRGRVLKDDQLLSAYHVEDGHTLHLVVREPIPLSQSTNDNAGFDFPPSAADTQGAPGGPRVVIGSFNISDQGQGGMPDINRILSAVFGSMGAPLNRNRNASQDASEPPSFVVHRTSGSGGFAESIRMQPAQVSGGTQHASQGPTSGSPLEHLNPPVIPDSLTTLSQYLNQVTVEFAIANGGDENSPFQGSPPFDGGDHASEFSRVAFWRGLPTPESLAEVLESTRQLLINQTAESLSPFPMGSLHSGVGPGSSSWPRNVDIRIRTGATCAANQGEQTGAQQSPEPVSQSTTGTQPAATAHRQTEVHIRPIRAVFGTVPARTSQSPEPFHNATGLVLPVMARVQPTYASATDVRGGSATTGGQVGGQPGAGLYAY